MECRAPHSILCIICGNAKTPNQLWICGTPNQVCGYVGMQGLQTKFADVVYTIYKIYIIYYIYL
jgi:hypothetical protein